MAGSSRDELSLPCDSGEDVTSVQRVTSVQGFTLPELLVATLISFLLSTAGFLFFRSQLRSLTDQSAGLDAIEGARASLDYMANEIRTAGEKPTLACGGCGLTAGNGTSLSISFDANGDGNATATDEQVSYAYNSGAQLIQRCTGANCTPSTTLIKNAASLAFEYFLSNSDIPVTTPTAAELASTACTTTAADPCVARVRITVQVNAARATTVTTTTLKSTVTLRNKKPALDAMGAT